jgi:DNA-binding transcriptional LysR family regulator
MPRLTVNFDNPRTRVIDVGGLFPPRLLGLVWHRDRELSEAAQDLIDAAREICRDIAPLASSTATDLVTS